MGTDWMHRCPKLTYVDLTGFTALEEVGSSWLYGCSNLESIIFAREYPKLRKVGWSWMSQCSNLEHVDLTGFTALEEIGDYWLYGCESLKSVTFAREYPKLKKIGVDWLCLCPALTNVDLTCFIALEEVCSEENNEDALYDDLYEDLENNGFTVIKTYSGGNIKHFYIIKYDI